MSTQWDVEKATPVNRADFRHALSTTKDALEYITGQNFEVGIYFYDAIKHGCTSAISPSSAWVLDQMNAQSMFAICHDASRVNTEWWDKAAYVEARFKPFAVKNVDLPESSGPVAILETKGLLSKVINFYARGGEVEDLVRDVVKENFPGWTLGNGQRSSHYVSVKCL